MKRIMNCIPRRVIRLMPTLCLAALSIPSAGAQAPGDPLGALAGRWVWIGDRDALGLPKACAERWEEFEPSGDGRYLKNRFPSGDGDGYTVLYQERNRVTLYLNKEKRRLSSGDRVIWIAIVDGPDRFRWRLYARPSSAAELRRTRVRCPS